MYTPKLLYEFLWRKDDYEAGFSMKMMKIW